MAQGRWRAASRRDRRHGLPLLGMGHAVLRARPPETLLRWHREGFRWFWKRKSKGTSPTPKLAPEIILFIKERAKNNQLWGAERIRGELLKLDMRVCKRTIQK